MSTILIISPEPWSGHSVSKHHYASELAKRGHTVIFHGPPDTRHDGLRLEVVKGVPGDLRVLHSPQVAPGLRFLPATLRRALEARWLRKVEAIASATIDMVWNFENSRFFDLRFAGDRLKIYHQVDLNQDFHPKIAAETADLSIAISDPIERRLKSSARSLIRITHGCPNVSNKQLAPASIEERFSKEDFNAVLTGNFDIQYLDVLLLKRLVEMHPNVCFHFVGKFTHNIGLHAAVGASSNAIFWGHQPSEYLSSFLDRADVLLVTYLADDHLDQLANPHKIMEYLTSGRCVLATRTLEYEESSGLVEIAQDRDDFLHRFSEIVATPSFWNTPEMIAKRRAYASDNTYSKQLDRIAEALGPKGYLIS